MSCELHVVPLKIERPGLQSIHPLRFVFPLESVICFVADKAASLPSCCCCAVDVAAGAVAKGFFESSVSYSVPRLKSSHTHQESELPGYRSWCSTADRNQFTHILVLKDTEDFANIKFLLLDPQGEIFKIERIGKNERKRTRTQTRTSATDLAQYRRAQFQSDCQRSSTYWRTYWRLYLNPEAEYLTGVFFERVYLQCVIAGGCLPNWLPKCCAKWSEDLWEIQQNYAGQ